MKRRVVTGIVLLCGLAGCVTGERRDEAGDAPRRPLPSGAYQHDVDVLIDGMPPQSFQGALKVAAGRSSLVLLTPFGTTLLRIADEGGRDRPRVLIYAQDLRSRSDKITKIYLGLRPALLDLATTRVALFGRDGQVTRSEVDGAGIPRRTTIRGKGYEITVAVRQYELAPKTR
jgi:hypothetical protein